jgi:poly(3-hydroxybutyrate) depolymerase
MPTSRATTHVQSKMSRRRLVESGGLLGLATALAACGAGEGAGSANGGVGGPRGGSPRTGSPKLGSQATPSSAAVQSGRLVFRPERPVDAVGSTGRIRFDARDGSLLALGYVPRSVQQSPLRLVVMLHGAGGQIENALDRLLPFADDHGLLVLAPKSLLPSWDVIHGSFGPDVLRISQLLEEVSATYPVDAYTVAGFSDGASYALSLGIGNGDLFDSVIAFSPGFSAAQVQYGRPRFFISHGTNDPVLPIDATSRQLVPQLKESGYDVTYQEFDGVHAVPQGIAQQAMNWLDG